MDSLDEYCKQYKVTSYVKPAPLGYSVSFDVTQHSQDSLYNFFTWIQKQTASGPVTITATTDDNKTSSLRLDGNVSKLVNVKIDTMDRPAPRG